MDSELGNQIFAGIITGLILLILTYTIQTVRLVRETADQSKATAKILKRHMRREEIYGKEQAARISEVEDRQDKLAQELIDLKAEMLEAVQQILDLMPKRRDDTGHGN